ncbi:protein kinase [Rhodococcus pseudokoreensis]|uniref:Protein kinase n=1 Tax=Rhodococcus pseudokoreensis TaxID=2811421 RepID=A0A974ZSZ6_9NOCA|nr:protein kinase [Rhodococcus pseudokoreensis]QSE89351.1 protein kinase [Rhodococcus pseudokoreensis]
MAADDPFETERAVTLSVTEELIAAGFEDAHEIGRGGFGVVYRCLQPSLDRTVAVKILEADLDEENRARFFREQRAMGRLTGHPNIVTALHVGVTGSGRPYIVMPYHPKDSLEARIRRNGPLPLEDALRLGVKIAAAVESAHREGILHRDVKPANILLTNFDEPALTDFGIAHVSGGFQTATGTVTGSPAFTAPEVLSGDPPTESSDVYSLGATVFSAITGHAAFERRSGEQVIAQFLRITTQPVPDLREQGIPDEVSEVIERAMAADPEIRPPTAAAFGDELRRIQNVYGFPVDEMALSGDAGAAGHDLDLASTAPQPAESRPAHRTSSPAARASVGDLPLALTNFVGRRNELAEAKSMLSASRLVTLTGIGGVGKTRLALRVAADARKGFADGVRWVELGELQDESLVVGVVAAALGVRDRSARRLDDVVAEFLTPKHLLLILDNCEHVVDAAAALTERLLHTCPELRVLTTSREALALGGEAVLRVPPLAVPASERTPTLRGLPQYDAVTLFVDRASAAVPGFELTEDNRGAVSLICQQLDGLPLSIELAAARLRAMSPEQILERLTDRYTLLTRGSRGAPSRQQTLRLSIDWSHDLCTPREQQLWARLSVFAGSFELDAAEDVCATDLAAGDLLDAVTSLVDKSILIREDAVAVVRFRMLETLRDYGREKSEQSGEHPELRRRHRDWYQQLVLQAEAEWISPRQREWIGRLEREQANLRGAMEYSLSECRMSDPGGDTAGLRIAASLFQFWLSRSLLSEGRHWLSRALACLPEQPTAARVDALYADSILAELQGEISAGVARVDEAHALAEQIADPVVHARVAHADGLLALYSGDVPRACTRLEEALEGFGDRSNLADQVWIRLMLGLAYELQGDVPRAIACQQQVLDTTEAHGESVLRSYSLWAMAVAVFQQGEPGRADRLLKQCIRLTRLLDEPLAAAVALETQAWIAAGEGNTQRAAVLLAAAEALGRSVGSSPMLFDNLLPHHEHSERQIHAALGAQAIEAAYRKGTTMNFEEAVAFALGEHTSPASPRADHDTTSLTKRERQVADLVSQGLTNKAIATQLVISLRTAQGHVENILTKLGFTSRTQIAAWVAEHAQSKHG